MKLSPGQAIKMHCKCCYGGSQSYVSCDFAECPLHDRYPDRPSSNVKRIRQFCLTCVENYNLVKECDGELTNIDWEFCPLHPFRLGKNPNMKGKGRENNLLGRRSEDRHGQNA